MSAENHPLTWAAPRPLWRAAARPGLAPAILRFAQDDFAQQLLGAMDTDPASLAAFVARYEDWRTPPGRTATPDLAQRVPLPAPVRQNRRKLLRAGPVPVVPPSDPAAPMLKLYQPAHQRHYVATATLACATSGLPDRKLRGAHDSVGMVLRRLMPARAQGSEALVEYAWVAGEQPRWQRVSDSDDAVLAPGEEMLPLFPIAHRETETIRRKTWGGVIPVGKREDYLAAPVVREAVSLIAGQKSALAKPAPAARPDSVAARLSEFRMDVAEPWKATLRAIFKEARDMRDDAPATDAQAQNQARLRNYQLQMQSWLLLLDFGKFLKRHLPDVAARLGTGQTTGLRAGEAALLAWLRSVDDVAALRRGMRSHADRNNGAADAKPYRTRLSDALVEAMSAANEDKLEGIETDYVPGLTAGEAAAWPGFHFLLAGIATTGTKASLAIDGPFKITAGLPPARAADQIAGPDCPDCPPGVPCPACSVMSMAEEECAKVDRVTALIEQALTPSQEEGARSLPFAERLTAIMLETADDEGLFCIRFVHCNADCGPLHPPTVSQPTERFRMASFFDPDAPAREIKIILPRDTSPAGLRKHARGTAFVMSNILCGQVQRAKGLGLIDLIRQVLPWPLHKDIDAGQGGGCKDGGGVDIGMICSLSIPIVTLCALILLMIIVSLLDFIFKWVPWLIACFPLPKYNAKGGSG